MPSVPVPTRPPAAARASWLGPALATLLLAAGLGSALAAFLVIDAVLFQDLPYPAPQELMALAWDTPRGREDRAPVAVVDDLAEEARSTSAFAGWRPLPDLVLDREGSAPTAMPALTSRPSTRTLRAWQVTHGFLPLLGSRPLQGLFFTREQEDLGSPVAVISHGLWRDVFRGDPACLGSALLLDGQPRTVIGVAPPGLELPGNAAVDVFLPLDRVRDPVDYTTATHHWLARLKAGTRRTSCQAELEGILQRRAPAIGFLPRLQDLHRALLGREGLLSLAALALAAFLAALLGTRLGLLALRPSTLARPFRTGVQVLLAALAAAAGAAWLASPALPSLLPGLQPLNGMARLGPTWHALACLLCLATLEALGLLFLVRRRREPRLAGLITQSTLAVLMLVLSGLFIRGFARVIQSDPGLDPRDLYALRLHLSEARYGPGASRTFRNELLAGLAALQELESVSAAASGPMGDSPREAATGDRRVLVDAVSGGHFEALRATLLRGRGIQEHDAASAVLSETLARELFPGASPLGRRLRLQAPWLPTATANPTVVGVCRDIRRPGTPPPPLLYLPIAALPDRDFTLCVRSPLPPQAIQRLVAARLLEQDPFLSPGGLVSMEALAGAAHGSLRQTAVLMGVSAFLALLLAALGIRSVIAGTDALRGTGGPALRRALLQSALGALLGVGSALVVGWMVKDQVGGVPVFDPGIILLAVLLFGLTGGLVALFPALRAAREEARRRSREAQWAQLKGQLNPHVFFNAMNNLTALIRKDPVLAEKAAEDLTSLFRRLMAHGHKPVAPLGEERALLEAYLSVEGLRFGPRLQVTWEWDPALDAVMAPPFMVQPLVENAIKHGLSPCPAGGELRITGRLAGGRATLRVENGGLPFTARRAGGLGLENLESRLRLFFPRDAWFHLGSESGRTVAELSFPILQELT